LLRPRSFELEEERMATTAGNPLVHWELMVSDVKKAKDFYGRVFDWQFDDERYPGYTLILTGGEPGGGLLQRPPDAGPCALNTYFEVGSVDRTLAVAVELGGEVLVEKTPIPGVGSFAVFADPDGIRVAVLEPA
jgi:uncharacterized protein